MTCPKCGTFAHRVEYEPQDGPHAGVARYYHPGAPSCTVVELLAPESRAPEPDER